MAKKDDYNAGVETGLKISTKVMEQQVEALDYLKSKLTELSDAQSDIKTSFEKVIFSLNESDIEKLFGVCNKYDPKDLKDHEKKLLLSLIAKLGINGNNDLQKKYANNIRGYLNLQGYTPQIGISYSAIEEVESIKSRKSIVKVLREYLYLGAENFDFQYEYDELFDAFELKSFKEIDTVIELIDYVFGVDGIIGSYGEFEPAEDVDSFVEIDYKTALAIVQEGKYRGRGYVETDNYVVFPYDQLNSCNLVVVNKNNLEQKLLYIKTNTWILFKNRTIAYFGGDNIIFYDNKQLYVIDIEKFCDGSEEYKDNIVLEDITKLDVSNEEVSNLKVGYISSISALVVGLILDTQLTVFLLEHKELAITDCLLFENFGKEREYYPCLDFIFRDNAIIAMEEQEWDFNLEDINKIKHKVRFGMYDFITQNRRVISTAAGGESKLFDSWETYENMFMLWMESLKDNQNFAYAGYCDEEVVEITKEGPFTPIFDKKYYKDICVVKRAVEDSSLVAYKFTTHELITIKEKYYTIKDNTTGSFFKDVFKNNKGTEYEWLNHFFVGKWLYVEDFDGNFELIDIAKCFES